jgi:hypothetical protein
LVVTADSPAGVVFGVKTRVIFRFEFFPFLNFLGVYVVFAIGADDVFVACDKVRRQLFDRWGGLLTPSFYCRHTKVEECTVGTPDGNHGTDCVPGVALFGQGHVSNVGEYGG